MCAQLAESAASLIINSVRISSSDIVDIDGLETSCYDERTGERVKVPSLRSRIRAHNHYQIRPARNDDWFSIERLLGLADRHYLALEWWTIQEWLGSPTFLLATDQHGRTVGLMLTVASGVPVAWLRAISVISEGCLTPLLEASVQAAQAYGSTGIAFLGSEGWILSTLDQGGLRQVNQVITLRCRGPWLTRHGPSGLQVQQAGASDIAPVLAVDHAAFAPMWWYSREVLVRAMNIALSFDVAYVDGEYVGYQLSTLRNGRGHIVRLAVHPRWHRQGIAARLLSEAMNAFDESRAESVTVNTQEDNLASLELYRRFSFHPAGNPWAVWFQSLVKM